MNIASAVHWNKVSRFYRIMSPYLHFSLFAGLLVQPTLGLKWTVDGILYKYVGRTTDYSIAEKECHKNGGHLAKITSDLLSNTGTSPLKAFMGLAHLKNRACHWIGMADLTNEGDWRWFDGSPVKSVNWEKREFLSRLFFPKRPEEEDCGKLCLTPQPWVKRYDWEWGSSKCVGTRRRGVICQYDVSNVTHDPAQPTLRSQKKPKAHSRRDTKPAVIVRTSEHFYISGLRPVVDKRVKMMSSCSRICVNKCRYINFNDRTGHCRGYAGAQLTGKKDSSWELWEAKQVGVEP